MLKRTRYLIFLAISSMVIGCKSPDAIQDTSFSITALLSDTVVEGTSLQIKGSGFGNSNSRIKVFFDLREGSLQSVTDTAIIVTVPSLVQKGTPETVSLSIQVATQKQTLSKKIHIIPFEEPHPFTLTYFTPTIGFPNNEVYLFGKGFGDDKSSCSVFFGDRLGTILSINDSVLIVTSPFRDYSPASTRVSLAIKIGATVNTYIDSFTYLANSISNDVRFAMQVVNSDNVSLHFDNTQPTNCIYDGHQYIGSYSGRFNDSRGGAVIFGDKNMSFSFFIDTANKKITGGMYNYADNYTWQNTFLGGPDGDKSGEGTTTVRISLNQLPYIINTVTRKIQVNIADTQVSNSIHAFYYENTSPRFETVAKSSTIGSQTTSSFLLLEFSLP